MAANHKPTSDAPPPAYGSDVSSPAPAHVQPANGDYYGAMPHQGNDYPPQNFSQSHFPQQQQYPPQMQYYQPGPQQQMGYNPQGHPGPQGGYGPPGGYGGYPPQGGYYRPQGQYVDNRDRGMGAGGGFLGACLGALACCCCLDFIF